MGEALEMRHDRKCGHTERYGETNWEGIDKDVFGEVVLDTIGIMLQRENDAWEANTGKIKK